MLTHRSRAAIPSQRVRCAPVGMGDGPRKAAEGEPAWRVRSRVRDSVLRVGEMVGLVEQTQFAPSFLTVVERFTAYANAADGLVAALLAVLQPNPGARREAGLACAPKQDPTEQFARSLKLLRPCLPKEREVSWRAAGAPNVDVFMNSVDNQQQIVSESQTCTQFSV